MKQFQFTLFFFFSALNLLIWQSCQSNAPDTKEIKETFGDGKLSRTYQLVKGKKEGKMTDYYPSGELKGERWFQQDLQVGRTVLYYKSGRIMEAQHYLDGVKEGGDSIWYESGQLKFTVAFKNGKKEGRLNKWSETGELIVDVRYEADSLVEVKGKAVEAYKVPDLPLGR
ncbi:MAG: hypothetical protein IT260_03800 [Saprospiraceae bacterium]|nr:hypothetical protein [Saprospiraceae bacterium]